MHERSNPVPAIDPGDAGAAARLQGRLEAEELDRGLRDEERREREEALLRALRGRSARDVASLTLRQPEEASSEILRLRHDVQRLGAMHHAIVHSRGWRALQFLRRLAGRAW